MAFLDNKEVGNRLKAKRKLTNLSARQFAMKAGVDQSQYAKIERGDLPITENIMGKLAKVHGLDEKSILHGMNVPRGTLNGSDKSTEAQQGGKPQNQGIDPAKEIKRLNDRQITIEAKIDVLFDVAVELLSATSGESGTLIRKKLEKRVDELKKFAQ